MLYQWASTQPTAPSGSTVYTWATSSFTGPATIGSWATSAGDGDPGEFLWENSEWISNNSTAATTTFTWDNTTVTSIGYIALDGEDGSDGSSG